MKITALLALVLSLTAQQAQAIELKLEVFDQFKLGELLGNLPVTVRTKVVTNFVAPRKGFEVKSTFPKKAGPFSMKCSSSYFGGALYPSYTTCSLIVNETHPDATLQNDEFKILIKDQVVAKALFEAIPYNSDEKEFNSSGKEVGLTFDDLESYVFQYRLVCKISECFFTFSNKHPATPETSI